ncbi:hypothetical protein F5I97DRAFT_1636192 [Phlebopus sp. FC_14]|nr:hypothetical protein F5I97DRAFT_1636192 [Phlebopus sp. FC_14]
MSSPPSSDSVSADSSTTPPAITAVRGLLKETLRIVTSDNRVFLGTFVGTDQLLNILLVNTEEYLLGPECEPAGRFVGQVMVPWRMITQVEAPLRLHNEQRRRGENGGSLYL